MVRAVKTKQARSLAKGQRALLLPGPTTAEPWELWTLGGKTATELVQVCQSPLDNRLSKSTTLALPVAQVYCLPLWLNETDSKLFGGMIPLQIELRGLQPRGADAAVFDWSVVAQEGSRTLVMVGVLPANLPPELHAEAYEAFDVSARFFSFPENALTIWREHDRLNAAITRGRNLVYYQVLAEGRITSRVVQDLNCTRATLTMQGVIAELEKVELWTEVSAEEITALQGALSLPVEQGETPAPTAPAQAWKMTPSVVGEARRVRASRRWQKQALFIFLALYLVAVGWLVMRFVLLSQQVEQLKKWQTDHTQALDLVHQGRSVWKDLEPVVDTKNYPLELLLEASQAIPTDQLHLTLFQSGNEKLLIKGEAKNVEGAFQFLSKLKADPYFSGDNLVMGNPRPLPNDLAQFQIEGSHEN